MDSSNSIDAISAALAKAFDKESGSSSVNIDEIISAFIHIARQQVEENVVSEHAKEVINHIENTSISTTSDMPIKLTFEYNPIGGNSRKSLNPNSDGIKDIVLLINNGMNTRKNPPVGTWVTSSGEIRKYTKGLKRRPPSFFIEETAEAFMSKYGKQYNVVSVNINTGSEMKKARG